MTQQQQNLRPFFTEIFLSHNNSDHHCSQSKGREEVDSVHIVDAWCSNPANIDGERLADFKRLIWSCQPCYHHQIVPGQKF